MSSDSTGAGRSLPPSLLIIATISSLSATLLSLFSIYTHLKRYLKPHLQRHVIRLILIVPIYSTSSLIGLFSLPAAFLIDLIRDLYEAFAIYSFFELLVAYLGGERSTLILLVGRKPIEHPWPFKLVLRELDLSDPYTFLAIKRGVLQYVQIKPILAASTVILKSFGKYQEGEFKANNGYTYISTVYNISIFLSLYCLALFWSALSSELAPFRPTSKFLTVKGVVFATFWQGWAISVFVAAGIVRSIGPISDADFLRLGLQDLLLTLEMPLFALGHMYAFSPSDYVDTWATHQARLPILYALRDSLGGRDVTEDIKGTMRGTGYGYARFEPARGAVHQGVARSRRLDAGLRYTQGGKGKYFLPTNGLHTTSNGGGVAPLVEGSRIEGPFAAMRRWMEDKRMRDEGYAPLSAEEAAQVIHENSDQEDDEQEGSGSMLDPLRSNLEGGKDVDGKTARRRKAEGAAMKLGYQLEAGLLFFSDHPDRRGHSGDSVVSLDFHSPPSNASEEEGYEKARKLDYGDYAFPTIACNHAGHFDEERGRGEQQALLGRSKGKSGNGSRERRKRVEGWLERMRNAVAREGSDEDEEEAAADETVDDAGEGETTGAEDEVTAKGKKRKSVGGNENRKKAKQGEDGKKKETAKKSVWGGWADGDDEAEEGTKDAEDTSGSKKPSAKGDRKSKNKSSSSSNKADKAGKTKSKSGKKASSSSTGKPSSPTAAEGDQAEEAGAVDLIISDPVQEEREMARERRRGDTASRVGGGDAHGGLGKKRVFRKVWTAADGQTKTALVEASVGGKGQEQGKEGDLLKDGQGEVLENPAEDGQGKLKEGVVIISDEPPPGTGGDLGQVAVQVTPPIALASSPSAAAASSSQASSSSSASGSGEESRSDSEANARRRADEADTARRKDKSGAAAPDSKNKTPGDTTHPSGNDHEQAEGSEPSPPSAPERRRDEESDGEREEGDARVREEAEARAREAEHQMPVYQRHEWGGVGADDSVDGGRNPWT